VDKLTETLKLFYSVALRPPTYLNLLYLLLSFPLGAAYFIFLTTGFIFGVSLIFVFVGFVIFIALMAGWWLLLVFERLMAIALLGVSIPPLNRQGLQVKGLRATFRAYITNPVTWKGLLFLLLKFPLGILNFSITASALALAVVFMAAPFIYRAVPMQVWLTWNRVLEINSLPAALAACLLGVILLFSTLHLGNGLAWVSGRLAVWMLGNTQEPLPGPLQPDKGWPKIDPNLPQPPA
jgi:hypothetical protein